MTFTTQALQIHLAEWRGLLGESPTLDEGDPARELWPVRSGHGEDFFLKRLGPWRNLPIVDEHRMLMHLYVSGINVPIFEVADSGSLTAGPAEDSFVVFRAIENAAIDPRRIPALEERVGAATARLHATLARYPRPLRSYTEDIAGALVGLRLSAALLERLQALREVIIDDLAVLPRQIVHGDFTPENVLRNAAGKVTGFIDFDHLPLAPRIWDIAKYLSRRLRCGWREGVPEVDPLECVEYFLSGYHQVSRLSEAEVRALPGALLAQNLVEAGYDQAILDGVLERRMLPDHRAVLQDTLRTIDWQLSNHAMITRRILDAI